MHDPLVALCNKAFLFAIANPMGRLHVHSRTYVHVRAIYVMYREPFIWENQPAQRGVVIKNTSTEGSCRGKTQKVQKLNT